MTNLDNFEIHVDPSCLTENSPLTMQSSSRNPSDKTFIHRASESDMAIHDSYNDDNEMVGDEETQSYLSSALESSVEGLTPMSSLVSTDTHTEALIRSAAREVVAMMEQEEGFGENDSLLSSAAEDDESHIHETELSYVDETELGYDSGEVEATEGQDEPSRLLETEESKSLCLGTTLEDLDEDDENLEEGERRKHEYTVNHDLEPTKAEENYDGSGSSHHSDDIFSSHSSSKRSSVNSLSSTEQKQLPELSQHDSISRTQSRISNTSTTDSAISEPLTSRNTPKSKVLNRPPFRTPSSVRAMQMDSPSPSLFSADSRKSSRRPTISRLGTPTAHGTRIPTKFKAKREQPLVLLHVTVLPSQFPYASLLDSLDVTDENGSKDLVELQELWRLLNEKMSNLVLERGILLSHPQDDFEVLEERLLDAVELPFRPRARILSCGHYLGEANDLSDSELSMDDYGSDVQSRAELTRSNQWCDICGFQVRFSDFKTGRREKSFKVKVYASNGLMGAGAWSAAWREMERVDVEIEPLLTTTVIKELQNLAVTLATEVDYATEHVNKHVAKQHEEYREEESANVEANEAVHMTEEAELLRCRASEERLREIYGEAVPVPVTEETHVVTDAENPQPFPLPQIGSNQYLGRDRTDDSLPDLLLAALKIALRDRRNLMIFVLSILVLLLAVRPSSSKQALSNNHIPKMPSTDAGASVSAAAAPSATESVVSFAAERLSVATAVAADIAGDVPPAVETMLQKVGRIVESQVGVAVEAVGEAIVKSCVEDISSAADSVIKLPGQEIAAQTVMGEAEVEIKTGMEGRLELPTEAQQPKSEEVVAIAKGDAEVGATVAV